MSQLSCCHSEHFIDTMVAIANRETIKSCTEKYQCIISFLKTSEPTPSSHQMGDYAHHHHHPIIVIILTIIVIVVNHYTSTVGQQSQIQRSSTLSV